MKFKIFLFLMLVFSLSFLFNIPEAPAQKFIKVDSLTVNDKYYQCEISPYGETYIDLINTGLTDSVKLYLILYGKDSTKAQSSMAENQITFGKDSLLIVPVAHNSRTWKVMDKNVWKLYLVRANDSGTTANTLHFIIRGIDRLYNSRLQKQYEHFLTLFTAGKINLSEFRSLYYGEIQLTQMQAMKRKFLSSLKL